MTALLVVWVCTVGGWWLLGELLLAALDRWLPHGPDPRVVVDIHDAPRLTYSHHHAPRRDAA